MNIFLSFLIIVIETIGYYSFQNIFFKVKNSKLEISVIPWIAFVSISCGVVSYYCDSFFYIKMLAYILIYVFGMRLIERIPIDRLLVVIVFYLFILAAEEFLVVIMNSRLLSYDEFSGNCNDKIIVIISKIILLAIICGIDIKTSEGRYDSFRLKISYVIFPMVSLIFIHIIFEYKYGFDGKENVSYLGTLFFCIVSMNVLAFVCMRISEHNHMKFTDKKMMEIDYYEKGNYYELLNEKLEYQRNITHEYRNHTGYIQGLLHEGKYENALKYIDEINGKFEKNLDLIDTNNDVVNTIVNSKYFEAKAIGTVVVCKINDLSNLMIESSDLVVLLSNLFNNSIEGLKECDSQKMLKFKIVMENGLFIINFINTYSGELVKNGNSFKTIKKYEEGLHGYGLKHITEIVNKYGGSCEFKASDNIFITEIAIDFNENALNYK